MTDLVLGAVAYDPKVVQIWDGFRRRLRAEGLSFDYVLYSHYERQIEDLVAGRIDIAWNSPLAWVRGTRLARASEVDLTPLVMRDTDRDLTSVVIVQSESPVTTLRELAGRVVATGAVDSPQSTLLPLSLLRKSGLQLDSDLIVHRHEIGVGLHGDHIGGEREAARALACGAADAACLIDSNLLLFAQEGTLAPGATRVLAQTPPYDHCILAAGPSADPTLTAGLRSRLLAMSYADPQVRPLLDLEGLKEWVPARLTGFAQLERAVDETGFYDSQGEIRAADYRP